MVSERSQFIIKLAVFKKKCQYYNVGNNFVLVYELEILFPNINEGINCKNVPAGAASLP